MSVAYGIIFFLITSSAYPIHLLNAVNGVGLFIPIASLTFHVPVILMGFLAYRLKGFSKIVGCALLIYSIQYIQIRSPYIVNNSILNTGLLNAINQYHPPLLFYFLIRNSYSFTNKKPFVKSTNALLVSFLLSMWWANQELFWGSYWNWDPVELTLLLVLTITVSLTHITPKSKQLTHLGSTKRLVWFITITACYIINRSPIAHSVHKFVNTFFSKIDLPIFYAMVMVLLLTVNLIFCYYLVGLRQRTLRALIYFAVLTSILIANFLVLQPHRVFGVNEKYFFKSLILSSLLVYKIYYNKSIKNTIISTTLFIKKMSINTNHVLPVITFVVILWFNEPASTILYTGEFPKTKVNLFINDVLLESSINTNNWLFLDRNFYKNCNKNYTFLKKSCDTFSYIELYQKSNNSGCFFVINSCNLFKFLWVRLLVR